MFAVVEWRIGRILQSASAVPGDVSSPGFPGRGLAWPLVTGEDVARLLVTGAVALFVLAILAIIVRIVYRLTRRSLRMSYRRFQYVAAIQRAPLVSIADLSSQDGWVKLEAGAEHDRTPLDSPVVSDPCVGYWYKVSVQSPLRNNYIETLAAGVKRESFVISDESGSVTVLTSNDTLVAAAGADRRTGRYRSSDRIPDGVKGVVALEDDPDEIPRAVSRPIERVEADVDGFLGWLTAKTRCLDPDRKFRLVVPPAQESDGATDPRQRLESGVFLVSTRSWGGTVRTLLRELSMALLQATAIGGLFVVLGVAVALQLV